MDDQNKQIKRSKILRGLIGLSWFLIVNIVFVFAMAELVSVYANSVATGQEAIEIDRALSKKLGGTIGVFFILVSAILCVRWSIIGFLPGTSKYKG
ncbi:hypothetical protein NBRC116493_02520 [Aurantivibrio infirmus]